MKNENDSFKVRADLASLKDEELQAIKSLEQSLGDKYYLIAYKK